jgi:HlyD family secretion protein
MTNIKADMKLTKPENQAKRSKKGKNRLWLTILFVAVAVMVTVLLAATRDAAVVGADSETVPVRQQDLIVTVTEGGSIRAHKSIQYKCQVERRRDVSEVSILEIVPAGTYITKEDVDKGMVLVQLDSSALEEALTQENMELASDRENATAAEESYRIQELQNESDIADGKLNVRFALLDLQKYLGNEIADKLIEDVNTTKNLTEQIAPIIREGINDPNILAGSAAGEEMKRLQDNIVLAEGNLKTAQDTLTGTRKLHDANYVSDLELQRDELSVQNRQFSLDSAKVALQLFKDYDFPKSAEEYLSNYIEAGRRLERTYAECRSRMAQAQARLSNAKERFHSQTERVNELKEQIENCTIRAKAPGLVIYGTGDSDDIFRAMRGRGGGMSSGIIAEGEVVTEGQVIVSMPDTAEMVAEISVHETEVDKVRPGQPATIVMDAFPDRVLQGEVIEVAPLPDQQRGWMNPDLKVYKTLVKISGTYDFLKSRMSCKVQILVRSLEDILTVPIQVVSNRAGRKVCYVMTPSGPDERVVQTGIFNDTFVQIIDGLEEGEEVLLNPPQVYTELAGPTIESFQGRKPPEESEPSRETEGQLTGGPEGRGSRGMRSTDSSGFSEDQRPQMRMGGQFELTDEIIDKILTGMKQTNPEKAAELEQLRQDDPEKFKTELRNTMNSMMRQMMRGRNMQQQQGQNPNREGFGGWQGQQGGNRMRQESNDSEGN